MDNKINKTIDKKRANTDHIAHQVNVTGTGAHKNKKKYNRKDKHKKNYDKEN